MEEVLKVGTVKEGRMEENTDLLSNKYLLGCFWTNISAVTKE